MSLFWPTLSSVSATKPPTFGGRRPTRLFFCKSSFNMAVILYTVGGIVPLREFSGARSCVRAESEPRVGGKVPFSLAVEMSSDFNDRRDPSDSGRGPEREFTARLRNVSSVMKPRVGGTEPEMPTKASDNDVTAPPTQVSPVHSDPEAQGSELVLPDISQLHILWLFLEEIFVADTRPQRPKSCAVGQVDKLACVVNTGNDDRHWA